MEKLGGKGHRSQKKTRKLRSKLESCQVNPSTPSGQEDQRVMYQHDPVGACASSQTFSGLTKPVQQYSSPGADIEDSEDEEEIFLNKHRLWTRQSGVGASAHTPSAESPIHASFTAIQMEELQVEFRSMQDSLTKVRLPPDLTFSKSKAGMGSKSRDAAKALSTSARYVETSLKISYNMREQIKRGDLFKLAEEFEDLMVVQKNLVY